MTTERIYQQTPPNVQLSTLVTEVGTLNGEMTTVQAAIAALQAYNTPVAWDGVHDRVLGVGQHTVDSFTSATSMPLHIACGDGQIYELTALGDFTPAASGTSTLLIPNNTFVGTNSFTLSYTQVYGAGTVNGSNSTGAYGGFIIGEAASIFDGKYTIGTSTAHKNVSGQARSYETTNGFRFTPIDAWWRDTTTVWSSLGTVVMPNSWTGTITTKRIA